ncbi:hypothetical protein ALC56_14980 [Trachymyrmex septentrionalis]|uniref:Uncharacterized protein n=1 Tax=Trachymyrmex septentrionalis TaxID=34720 RepID=A0A151JTF6_9HYME|nr:hypothetical protein ALC56_14980 [Trachymyrmex septentrionalis]
MYAVRSIVRCAASCVYLLSRRYDLMNTGYKFWEIGINVGLPSYVEIVLTDHSGHELSLSLETWKSSCSMSSDGILQDASKRIQRQFYKCCTANS